MGLSWLLGFIRVAIEVVRSFIDLVNELKSLQLALEA
jgi:hypothetical protein